MMVYGFNFKIKKKAVLKTVLLSPFSSKIKGRAKIPAVKPPKTSLFENRNVRFKLGYLDFRL